MRESILPHLPSGRFIKISGPEQVYNYLTEHMETAGRAGRLLDLLEVYNCADPCDGGPGTGPAPDLTAAIKKTVVGPAGPESAENHLIVRQTFNRFNRELNLSDFMTS